MSSKVEQENQARQAAEADRLNKKLEREGRDAKTSESGRAAFAQLVNRSQAGQSEGKAKGERAQGEQAQASAKQGGELERAARMARGGVLQQSRVQEQARSFQGVLSGHTEETRAADKGRVERREQGSKKDSVDKDERTADVRKQESKRDVEADVARVEAREQGQANAAINADAGGGQGKGRGEQGAAASVAPMAADAAQGTQAARAVKQIPPELLEKLVSAVYLAVNDKGLKEFHIELKDGPLKGGLLKISADNGKIALSFSNLGGDEKRLVEASKGELMRRLEKKGLTLSRLDVR